MVKTPEYVAEIVETLSLTELSHICDVERDWIVELVEFGVLEPEGPTKSDWNFQGDCISVVRRARRLHLDLGINLPGIALALDLLENQRRLQRKLTAFQTESNSEK